MEGASSSCDIFTPDGRYRIDGSEMGLLGSGAHGIVRIAQDVHTLERALLPARRRPPSLPPPAAERRVREREPTLAAAALPGAPARRWVTLAALASQTSPSKSPRPRSCARLAKR
mmetsp:Transcript_29823/g.89184  ORF Transcript_29823/g.89184 Transcript_29823/m.89184 type:complete len:115 (-) Transcript_29823:1827-2171(-)